MTQHGPPVPPALSEPSASSAMLIIDVEPRAGDGTPGSVDAPVVLVEPLIAGPAVALAVEHGLERVIVQASGPVPDLAALMDGIQPDNGVMSGLEELVDAIARESALGAPESVLVSHLNLRPCAARIGAWLDAAPHVERLRIACVPAGVTARMISVDAVQLAGALARMLLEEMERSVMLSEAAGMAMTVAESFHDPVGVLEAGERWRQLRGLPGVMSDVPQLAGLQNTVAAVPAASVTDAECVARAWLPITDPHRGVRTP